MGNENSLSCCTKDNNTDEKEIGIDVSSSKRIIQVDTGGKFLLFFEKIEN